MQDVVDSRAGPAIYLHRLPNTSPDSRDYPFYMNINHYYARDIYKKGKYVPCVEKQISGSLTRLQAGLRNH